MPLAACVTLPSACLLKDVANWLQRGYLLATLPPACHVATCLLSCRSLPHCCWPAMLPHACQVVAACHIAAGQPLHRHTALPVPGFLYASNLPLCCRSASKKKKQNISHVDNTARFICFYTLCIEDRALKLNPMESMLMPFIEKICLLSLFNLPWFSFENVHVFA
jgi:hypothetical protein